MTVFLFIFALPLLINTVSLSLSLSQAQASQQRPPAVTQGQVGQAYQPPVQAATPGPVNYVSLYPSLEDEYMGLQLTGYRPVSLRTSTTPTHTTIHNVHTYTCFVVLNFV